MKQGAYFGKSLPPSSAPLDMTRMTHLAGLLLVALCAGLTSALCPVVQPMSEFTPASYLGKWYEMKRVTRTFEEGGACTTATYSLRSDGLISVFNRHYLSDSNQYATITGYAELAEDAGDQARLLVHFSVTPVAANYWVLGTDYTSYSVVWSCTNSTTDVDAVPSITVWVLSRTSTMDNATQEKVAAILSANNVNTTYLTTTDQTNCPATTCSGCQIVQESLDLTKMAGTWWENQHSKDSDRAGELTCVTQTVSSASNGVEIKEQGTNGTQEVSITEVGVWNSTSNSGAFVLSGYNTDNTFCVLGTDYTGWAVVSKCVEGASSIIPVTGGLWVWSRKTSLTSDQAFNVSKVLVNAGTTSSELEATATTPCSTKSSSSIATTSASLIFIGMFYSFRVWLYV